MLERRQIQLSTKLLDGIKKTKNYIEEVTKPEEKDTIIIEKKENKRNEDSLIVLRLPTRKVGWFWYLYEKAEESGKQSDQYGNIFTKIYQKQIINMIGNQMFLSLIQKSGKTDMKTISIALILFFICCTSKEEQLSQEAIRLQNKVYQLNSEISNKQSEINKLINLKEQLINEIPENQNIKYILILQIKQKHFTLDLTKHAKDEMNKIILPIEVSKSFYNSINIGTILNEKFRIGSAWLEGSFGSWHILVKDKRTII